MAGRYLSVALLAGLLAVLLASPAAGDPPTITFDIAGTPGTNGWYRSNVTVSWTVAGHPAPSTEGCGPTVLTADTAGVVVTCIAKNKDGEINSTVTIKIDKTPPTISGSAAPPTNSFGWRTGNVTVSFACADADGSGVVSCGPSTVLTSEGAGQSVTGTAVDAAGNTESATGDGISIDKTPPLLTAANVGPVEATGPIGARIRFAWPTATDPGFGPVVVACNRPSPSTFPLGTTPVGCLAADGHGHTTTASFNVVVQDTTPPVLNVPSDITVYENVAGGASRSHPQISALLGVRALDIVDVAPRVTHNAPAVFPIGTTLVRFTAVDASGNTTSRETRVTVRANSSVASKQETKETKQANVATVDLTPPGEPAGVKVKVGDHKLKLMWKAPAAGDLKEFVITRSADARAPAKGEAVVYRGTRTSFTDRRVRNGVKYRYVIVSYDQAGNRSAGVAVIATPRALMLVRPRDGARVKGPVQLVWVPLPKADYFNVQLYRGSKKIMSVWPTSARLKLRASWVYEGRRYRLTPGRYRWFVFPGYGKRSDANYGKLLGQSTFVVS